MMSGHHLPHNYSTATLHFVYEECLVPGIVSQSKLIEKSYIVLSVGEMLQTSHG